MILIGEKLNGSIPAVARMIAERDGEQIRALARRQAEAGADFIDICAPMERGETEALKWMVEQVQSVTDVPVSIDSSNTEVLLEVYSACLRPGLFNSVSMESKKRIDEIFRIMEEQPDWQVIAMLCDDEEISRSTVLERRLQILDQIVEKARNFKINLSRIHIDPVAEAVVFGDSGSREQPGIGVYLDTVRQIRARYPEIHIISAVSNVSYGLPARKYMNYSFAALALEAGTDSGILDPLDGGLQAVICGTETLLGKKEEECGIEYIRSYKKGRFEMRLKPGTDV